MPGRYGALLDALHGLRWPARHAGVAGAPGAHAARQRGTAGDFTDVRPYRQGDDVRLLDWRLLARSDRAYVRLKDDRVIRPTWLVLDASARMAYPDPARDDGKWGMARALAVGLAAVAMAGGDPVGVVAVHAGGVLRLPLRTRRGAVGEVADQLDALSCGGAPALAPALAAIPPGSGWWCAATASGTRPRSGGTRRGWWRRGRRSPVSTWWRRRSWPLRRARNGPRSPRRAPRPVARCRRLARLPCAL